MRARVLRHARHASLDDVVAAVVGDCLRMIEGNIECAMRGADAEGVHQLRVGARRLRSALSLFRSVLAGEDTARLREELRWLGSALGPARDLDVFLEAALLPVLAGRPDDAALDRMRVRFEGEQALAYARMRDALSSVRCDRLTLDLAVWCAERGWHGPLPSSADERLFAPAAPFARALLERRHRKVCKLRRHLDPTSVAQLHALRIELKKLRYACDFCGDLFSGRRGRGAKRYQRVLRDLQDSLGRVHDAATAESLLAHLGRVHDSASEAEPAERVAEAAARGRIAGWASHEAALELAAAQDHLRTLCKTHRFWDERRGTRRG